MASSSSSALTTTSQVKYHVFLSFRGEDTRRGFTSFLYEALDQKKIQTFIDNKLVRGEEISPSLLKTIEESNLSVIIFSENYASSKWCLDELVKILECREKKGQIVVPVFYLVDPSHVRNQKGKFGDAFSRLIKEKALVRDKVQSFKGALEQAANLSGLCSREFESEPEFVQKIVEDILSKLYDMSSSDTMDRVGIDASDRVGIVPRVNKIMILLNMESPDVFVVGIWGMGGIGKTTIAEAVYSNIQTHFEGRYFKRHFREELKTRSAADLEREFLSQLLGQEKLPNTGPLWLLDSLTRDRLRRTKALIVLDDVDESILSQDLRKFICNPQSSFAPGSRILVTSRNKQPLKVMVGEAQRIYEVEGLNHEEALQLFRSKVSENCNATIDDGLLVRAVNLAQGNPLALIVLGSALNGKSKEVWQSTLNKLDLDPQIENVLRISYDGLGREQKSIFLDIAHFFIGWEQNQAVTILNGFYGPSVISHIDTLFDKCLITINEYSGVGLEMHDLLQEMALRIVRAESGIPGERSRLCDPADVVHVLKKKKVKAKLINYFFSPSPVTYIFAQGISYLLKI